MTISADLRSSRITTSFDVTAPREGRPATRINWLVRQLADSPSTVRVEAFFQRGRSGTAELLRELRVQPTKLILDPTKEIKSFTVAQVAPAGAKRSAGRGGFIDSILDAVDGAYEEIGQRLKPWTGTPPKIRADSDVEVEPEIRSDLPSAALSSQDE